MSESRRQLPRGCLVGIVLWLSLVCGGLVVMGVMSTLGAAGAVALEEPFVLRLLAGLLYLLLGLGCFLGLLRVVAGVRRSTQDEVGDALEGLGLRRCRAGWSSLAGVHYEGSLEGRRIDLYVRAMARRSRGRIVGSAGIQCELFVEVDSSTRAVVAVPDGLMAAALARLNRRFGLAPIERVPASLDGRRAWALDPEWGRRLLSRPVVSAAVDELVPVDDSGPILPSVSALHVQPQALYWIGRTRRMSDVPATVQRGLQLFETIVSVLPELDDPAVTADEGRLERLSRRGRERITAYTLLGCVGGLVLLVAVPLALLLLVAWLATP